MTKPDTGKPNTDKPRFVYVTYIRTTAEKLWRALIEPLVVYAFGLVVVMCLACAAFGTALKHVVFRRAVHS